MLNDKDTQAALRMVNENSYFHEIASHIIKVFPLDISQAKKMAEILVKQEGFTKEEILQGKADKSIANRLRFSKAKDKTVREPNKTRAEILLKTIKEKVNVRFVAGALGGVFLISGLINYVDNKMQENNEVTQLLGMLVAEPGSDAYEHKQSIVSQNTYIIPGQFDDEGFPISAYSNEKIAEDIIKICTLDPELFDLCMYDVYFDMNDNKLSNMDSVLRYLQTYTKEDESLQFINDRVANCDVFLDYLVSCGFANPNSKDYYKVLEDINKYEQAASRSGVPFNELPEESQKRLEALIENFEANKNNLYTEYKDNLENIERDNYGSRS